MTVFATPALALGVNGSFEVGADPGECCSLIYPGDANITGWTVLNGNIDYVGPYWQAADGVRSVDLNGLEAGSISQTVATTPGVVHIVTFYMSGNPESLFPPGDPLHSPSLKQMTVSASGAPSGHFAYDVEAKANTKTDMKWELHGYGFIASEHETAIAFSSDIGGAFGPALDNVTVCDGTSLTAQMCKEMGWQRFVVFKTQGDCVSFVASGGRNLPANLPVE